MEPLLDFLNDLRSLRLPDHPVFGGTTMNIGVLQAGTAPNVIAESARAEVIFRTGESIETLLAHVRPMAEGRVELAVGYRSDPVSFRCPKGAAGEVVSFACDLPLLPAWGAPILFGPGSIRDAHGAEEKVELPRWRPRWASTWGSCGACCRGARRVSSPRRGDIGDVPP